MDTKRKLLIDCDPGIDDCFAIMNALAYDNFDILGIMCVSGNKSLPIVSANALRIMDFEKRNIPVTKGAKASLKRLQANEEQENISAECHGSDGMGESGLPYSDRCLIDIPSWKFMLEKVKEFPNEIELVCLGPLTNIALAVLEDLETMTKLKSITIMGGSFYLPGNITPHAEYNIWFDAEAANIVIEKLGGRVDVRIVGIDATVPIVLKHGLLDFLSYEGGERGLLLERIARPYIHHYYDLNNVIGVIIHDLYCMLSIIDPSIITKKEQLTIEIPSNGEYRGATKVCADGKPITAILGFDETKLKRLFLNLMMPDKKELIEQYFPQL